MEANKQPTSRVEQAIEWAFLAVFGVLFLWALVAWMEIRPTVRTHRPGGFLVLTTGLLLQSIAALVRPRSRVLFRVLITVALAMLLMALRLLAS